MTAKAQPVPVSLATGLQALPANKSAREHINALRDMLNLRANLYNQLQAVDRQIAADLGQILNQLPP